MGLCFNDDMNYHVVTIFPEMFKSYLGESILARAQEKGLIKVSFVNPRDFTEDKHRKVDDEPYGGGPGMVMKAEPTVKAVEDIKGAIWKKNSKAKIKTILFSIRGDMFDTDYAKKTAKKYTDVILICGRYEGIDGRVLSILKCSEISIGDFVLTGGELPAMVLIDSISRQISGVLGTKESLEEERVSSRLVYTRPSEFEWKGKKYRVPKVLLSGDHGEIEKWRGENG